MSEEAEAVYNYLKQGETVATFDQISQACGLSPADTSEALQRLLDERKLFVQGGGAFFMTRETAQKRQNEGAR